MSTTTATLSFLQELEPLQEVPADRLQWLIDNSTIREFAQGDLLIEPGSPANEMIIILSGCFSGRIQRGNQWRDLGTVEAGAITGLFPYSRMKTINA